MRVERSKGIFSAKECAELNEWVALAIKNRWMDYGVSLTLSAEPLRYTSRLYGNRFVYPDLVRELSSRVRQVAGVDKFPLIDRHGRDGVVVSCIFGGGDVAEHQDPLSVSGEATLRCNVLTQAPTAGGALVLDGAPLNVEVGELHCYLASEHKHYVTPVSGDAPRIMWMFGAHVPKELWNNGAIKFGETQ